MPSFDGLPKVILVEDVGEARAPVTRAMQSPDSGSIALLMLGSGKDGEPSRLILRALGKGRFGHGAFSKLDWTFESAACWLSACSIQNVFVGGAERLTRSQFQELLRHAGEARIWLIYTDKVVHSGEDGLEGVEFRTESCDFLFSRFPDRRSSEAEWSWRDFPEVPLCSEFQFRARCAERFDAGQLAQVDCALEIGVNAALEALRKGRAPSVDHMVAPALDPGVPQSCALTMVRGAQLAALLRGFRLTLDQTRWQQYRSSIPTVTPETMGALKEVVAPRRAALVAIHACTGLQANAIRELSISDVALSGESVYFREHAFRIGTRWRPFLKAFIGTQSHRSADGPLFTTESRRQVSPAALRTQLDNALLACGLQPAAADTARSNAWRDHTVANHANECFDLRHLSAA